MQRLTRSSTVAAMGVGVGFAAYATFSYLPNAERLDDGSPRRTFTGQIGFQSLTLESVEQVNHNVKRLRFALPQKDAVSGLTLNCTYPSSRTSHECLIRIADAPSVQLHSSHTLTPPVLGFLLCAPIPLSATSPIQGTLIYSLSATRTASKVTISTPWLLDKHYLSAARWSTTIGRSTHIHISRLLPAEQASRRASSSLAAS